jgi:hypothetical protein
MLFRCFTCEIRRGLHQNPVLGVGMSLHSDRERWRVTGVVVVVVVVAASEKNYLLRV